MNLVNSNNMENIPINYLVGMTKNISECIKINKNSSEYIKINNNDSNDKR